jgi:hypothetical protein
MGAYLHSPIFLHDVLNYEEGKLFPHLFLMQVLMLAVDLMLLKNVISLLCIKDFVWNWKFPVRFKLPGGFLI